MRTNTRLFSMLICVLGCPAVAAAADPSAALAGVAPSDPDASGDTTPLAPGSKRAVPDYGGHPGGADEVEGASVGRTLLWVPRVALYPAHVVTEYGLRRPLFRAVTWSDEHYMPQRVHRFFTSEDGKRGAYPYFIVDTGLRPRAGAVAFADSFLHPDNDARISGSFARTQAFAVGAQDSLHHGDGRRSQLVLRASYAVADDSRFYGLGPDTDDAAGMAYGLRRFEGTARSERELGGLSRVAVFARFRDARFGASRYGGNGVDLASTHGGPGQPPLPPGWGGYQLLAMGSKLTLDSRDPSLDHLYGATGARLELDGALSAATTDRELRFADWGGELAGFVDVTGRENVFGARVAARFQENLGDDPVPFTERPSLGGAETMRGLAAGRLRSDSSVLAELQYRYSIWSYLDAELFSGVGNVFEGHLRGLEPSALLWSSGLSLRTTFSRDSSWAAGIAVASNRFDSSDFRVADHVRFFAGLNQGF